MTVTDNERLFDHTADVIETIADVVIQNKVGEVIEVGAMLSDDISLTYVQSKDVMRLYVHNRQVLEMARDDLILVAFKELITMQLV